MSTLSTGRSPIVEMLLAVCLGLSLTAPAGSQSAPNLPETDARLAPTAGTTWYTRVDAFRWHERIGEISDFVHESGPLYTFGVVEQRQAMRMRGELFTGTIDYQGVAQFEDHLEPLASTTRYLGVRGEYERLLTPRWLSTGTVTLGLGTRFWARDISDGMTATGTPILGYQEIWGAVYPYLGYTHQQPLGANRQWYGAVRVGATPLTYEFVSILDRPLWPRSGSVLTAELGMRSQQFTASAKYERISWGESPQASGAMQPQSILSTLGGQVSYAF